MMLGPMTERCRISISLSLSLSLSPTPFSSHLVSHLVSQCAPAPLGVSLVVSLGVSLGVSIVAQILVLFWELLLADTWSRYMRCFLIVHNKYYTFVTSPFLSASPSPAPVCSILGGPNRLDLWLDLCLKLLFSWTKSVEGDKRCCE